MHRNRSLAAAFAVAAFFGSAPAAQDNVIPGTDVGLGILSDVSIVGHEGPLGTGTSAMSMSTTSCNFGSVQVPWEAPMDADHPFIAFLIAREQDGRFEQISNLSYVKHGFFALANSQCIPCQGGDPGGDFLGIGCSDTYSTFNNSNNFWLGPSEEIDPWLGTWDPVCSFFDMGTNPQPGTMCDGNRSFTSGQAGSLGPIGNRVIVRDADLDPSDGAEFFYQGHYIVKGEPEANRENNLGSRPFLVQPGGGLPNLINAGPLLEGTVLQQWSGATVTSATNGTADGRFYVGVRVTGPVDGVYHYEYAVHNRDNARAGGGFRIPTCPGASVSNVFFGDIDDIEANDWSFAEGGGELSWSANGDPLRWNSIFNFAFDSDAAPVSGTVFVDQFFPGAGAGSVGVATTVPGGLFNVVSGPGCSNDTPPVLFSNEQATLGNAAFGVTTTGNDPAALTVLLLGALPGSTPLGGGCSIAMGGTLGTQILLFGSSLTNGAGEANFPLPVPNNANLEGAELQLQVVSQRLGGGPYLSVFDFSNGLSVRVGDSLTNCP